MHEWQGDMFGAREPTGMVLALAEVQLLTPGAPTKVIALWNNFHALGEKLNLAGAGRAAVPAEVAQLLPRARRAPSASRSATARWCSRASSASSSARPAPRCAEARGARPCVRLHLRQRRDGGRHPEPRRLVRAVGARQGLRHLLPDRPGDRHRPRPGDAHRRPRARTARCARTTRSATCASRWRSWSA